MKIGRHRDMVADDRIRIGSNSYAKVKTFKYLGSSDKSKFYSEGNKM